MTKFARLQDHNAYGYGASVGDRTVEVLRSFPGDWFVYAKDAGKVCKSRTDRRLSFSEAMREAREFLDRKITCEVWT